MKTERYVAKKIAVLAMLTGLSLITFIIENLFPHLLLPGAKMGLSNVFSFAALIMYSPLEGFLVVGIRTLLGATFAGNVSALLYSFTGGMVSMAVSSLLLYTLYPKISIMAISVAAAVMHNITQDLVYVLVTGTPLMLGYLPYFMLLGVLAGGIVGGVVLLTFRGVPQSAFERVIFDKTKKPEN